MATASAIIFSILLQAIETATSDGPLMDISAVLLEGLGIAIDASVSLSI